jgi:hypothetical protein
MTLPFAMFYADERHDVIDDGSSDFVEVTFRIPRKWAEAPVAGLQAVSTMLETERVQIHRGSDVYLTMPSGERMHTNDPSAMLAMLGVAKFGAWVPDPIFRAAQERANKWRNEQMEKK